MNVDENVVNIIIYFVLSCMLVLKKQVIYSWPKMFYSLKVACLGKCLAIRQVDLKRVLIYRPTGKCKF